MLGRPSPPELVADVVGRDPGEVKRQFDVLVGAGILRSSPRRRGTTSTTRCSVTRPTTSSSSHTAASCTAGPRRRCRRTRSRRRPRPGARPSPPAGRRARTGRRAVDAGGAAAGRPSRRTSRRSSRSNWSCATCRSSTVTWTTSGCRPRAASRRACSPPTATRRRRSRPPTTGCDGSRSRATRSSSLRPLRTVGLLPRDGRRAGVAGDRGDAPGPGRRPRGRSRLPGGERRARLPAPAAWAGRPRRSRCWSGAAGGTRRAAVPPSPGHRRRRQPGDDAVAAR